jgi:hypothetical protein
MPSGWKVAAVATVGLFGAGVAVGYVANKRGIPQEKVPRWLLKEATRQVLHAYDALQDLRPDSEPVPVEEALEEVLEEVPLGPRPL